MTRTSRFPGGWNHFHNQELGTVGEISDMFYILPTPTLEKSLVTDKTAPVEHPYKQDYCEAFLFSLTISKSNKPEKNNELFFKYFKTTDWVSLGNTNQVY